MIFILNFDVSYDKKFEFKGNIWIKAGWAIIGDFKDVNMSTVAKKLITFVSTSIQS